MDGCKLKQRCVYFFLLFRHIKKQTASCEAAKITGK